MHLLIPYASALSDASAHTLRGLQLPNLTRLLRELQAAPRDAGDEYTLSPPHERALAAAYGWHGSDGGWPWAALQAQADGIEPDGLPLGLLTPVHWHVGREHITLADPVALALDADESRALFAAVRPLFEDAADAGAGAGRLTWAAPLRWTLAHSYLADMRCASIDRAINRNVDLWLREDPHNTPERLARTRWVRRLQNEVQMLLHQHPINDSREARGALPVNSFWLSGCGTAQDAADGITVDDRLRAPLLAENWSAWADAWRALDADMLGPLLEHAVHGRRLSLTLCGERSAQRFDAMPRSLWQRISGSFTERAEPHAVLGAL
jgi:hypothetical protein